MARLGEILMARGALSAEALGKALENQVLFGGRLGTNLLEICDLSEELVARALGEQLRCPALWGEIEAAPAALRLLRPDRVDRLEVVPLQVDGRRLTVAVGDPGDLSRLDEVAFATGKQPSPAVVTESRLWDLMRRHYGLLRPVRGVDANAVRMRSVSAPGSPSEPMEDLMDEAAFNALYEPAASELPPAATAISRPEPEPEPAPPSSEAADAFRRALVSTEEVMNALQVDAWRSMGPGSQRVRPELAPGAVPEVPPLSFDEAVRELAGVADRNAIARVVLRCARARLRRAVLLTVRDRFADGWEGLGEGLDWQVVARLRVPLDEPGLFRTVVTSRAHFLGPLQKTAANVRFLRALGGGAPRNAFALPILARGRVVNVLYADEGRGRLVDPAGIADLLILATRIAQSYDVLLSRAR